MSLRAAGGCGCLLLYSAMPMKWKGDDPKI